LFDERFRFYYEDHDLCIRSLSAGWRILHVPAASAWHKVAGSTGTGSREQLYLLGRGSVSFYAAHTSGLQRALMVPYRLASAAKTVVEACVNGRPGAGVAYVHGMVDGLGDLAGGSKAPSTM
jgi:GT2 family glycosyltransferase